MRPHIEHVHQNRIPWVDGFLAGTHERTLSRCDETGADSVMVSFPAGWSHNEPRVLGAAEEMFVLAGTVTVGEHELGPMTYARLPEGTVVSQSQSTDGAIMCLFRNRPADSAPPAEADLRKYVAPINCLTVMPSPLRTPNFPNPEGVTRIDLFDDPDTGESTWILAGPSLHTGTKAEVHPVAEEMLLVAGQMHSPLGIMNAGAYFWRPADVWHGPYSTVSGCVSLFRTQGGPLSTVYKDETTHPSWNLPECPIVPADMELTGEHQTQLDLWSRQEGMLE